MLENPPDVNSEIFDNYYKSEIIEKLSQKIKEYGCEVISIEFNISDIFDETKKEIIINVVLFSVTEKEIRELQIYEKVSVDFPVLLGVLIIAIAFGAIALSIIFAPEKNIVVFVLSGGISGLFFTTFFYSIFYSIKGAVILKKYAEKI